MNFEETKIIEEIFQKMMEQIWIKTDDENKYKNVKRLIRETAQEGFKAGQESVIYGDTVILKSIIEKTKEQARQEALEEVEETISNEIRARYDLYPNEEPPFNEIHLLEYIFEALKKKEAKE